MQEPYWWYVLYVRANAEQRVIGDIGRFVKSCGFPYEFEPFCPETEVYYRGKKGSEQGRTYRKRPLFPGYVFIETNMPSDKFKREFSTYIYNSADIIRMLKQGASGEISLPSDERMRFEFLLKGKRCLEHSVGYIVGDRIQVECGPLSGLEGMIKYINRHNRYATIEVEMFGTKIKASVALEVVTKLAGDKQPT
ncbi:MAG: hypothetical protein NC184_02090 [Roseburia sp.]|nr:hypothetical protein [Roseburia sp.]